MDEKIHEVEIIKTDVSHLYLRVDGQLFRIAWLDCSAKLKAARQTEKEFMEVSPSGYGLHWPLIDEDLAITPLLKKAETLETEAAE